MKYSFARALYQRDRRRAIELAEAALALFETGGDVKAAGETRAWLTSHPR